MVPDHFWCDWDAVSRRDLFPADISFFPLPVVLEDHSEGQATENCTSENVLDIGVRVAR